MFCLCRFEFWRHFNRDTVYYLNVASRDGVVKVGKRSAILFAT